MQNSKLSGHDKDTSNTWNFSSHLQPACLYESYNSRAPAGYDGFAVHLNTTMYFCAIYLVVVQAASEAASKAMSAKK